MTVSRDQLDYLANLLTVLVLGAAVLWAASLAAQGKLGQAMKALSRGRV